jgi:biopolymer transport protein ExbB
MKRLLGIMLLTFGVTTGAAAAEGTLDQLLHEIRKAGKEQQTIDKAREQRFLADKNSQARLLKEAQETLSAEERRSQELKAQFEANEESLTQLEEMLKERSGVLGELFGVVRQVAGDSRATLEGSLVSAQYPGRTQPLEQLTTSKALPDVKQLEALWYALQHEMTEAGKVTRFKATVLGPGGQSEPGTVTRVGTFTAINQDGRYLEYLPENSRLAELPRQPAGRYRDVAEAFSNSNDGVTPMAIDPSRGAVLGLLVQSPEVMERLQQGGFIGYLILALGALGAVVAVVRLVYLGWVGKRIERQRAEPHSPREDNPLGRILAVAGGVSDEDTETLEGRLDEAILKEVPALERGRNLIKLLAAVAPLLGLLGTVTGMIATFQSISLFGTGDPKLMAGGISQALVTTMLGLSAAIPLLFLHSLVYSRSRGLVQVLDEQSAGLIAQRMEQAG